MANTTRVLEYLTKLETACLIELIMGELGGGDGQPKIKEPTVPAAVLPPESPTSKELGVGEGLDALDNAFDRLRESANPRLLAVVKGVDDFISSNNLPLTQEIETVPGNKQTEDVTHYFTYRDEQGRNIISTIGGTADGVGAAYVPITEYLASKKDPEKPQSVIGRTVYIYESQEARSIADPKALEDTTTAVVYQQPVSIQQQEMLDYQDFDAIGYSNGVYPAVITGNARFIAPGKTRGYNGFLFARHEDVSKRVDPMVKAEKALSNLQRAEYIGNRVGLKPMQKSPPPKK